MTIDEARGHIGNGVVYRSGTKDAEDGVITAVGHVWAFVRYGAPYSTPRATNPADLILLAAVGKSAAREGAAGD